MPYNLLRELSRFFLEGNKTLRKKKTQLKNFLKEFQRNFINEIPNVFEGYIKNPPLHFLKAFSVIEVFKGNS